MSTSKVLITACLALYLARTCDGFSSGVVTQSCGSLVPSAPNHGAVTAGTGDLTITVSQGSTATTTYQAGQDYSIQVMRTSGNFRGFLCQVRSMADMTIVGEVIPAVPADADWQGLTCSGTRNSASHRNGNDKTSVTYTWRASGATPASVRVECAVVITRMPQVWHSIQSGAIALMGAAAPAPEAPRMNRTTAAPGSAVQIDLTGCARTKGCRRLPEGCTSTADCSYIYTHQLINNSTIQIELSAQAAGWVAVGYSTDSRMGGDDVFACQADSTGSVFAKNLYNDGYSNVLDSSTDPTSGFSNISTSLSNGVIACRFTRSIAGSGNRDLNLRMPHTLFFTSHATGTAAANSPLSPQHVGLPTLSSSQISVASNFSIGGVSFNPSLLRAHAIMMTYSWMALSVNGMFTARFMRGNYPPPKWFQYHQALMAITLVLAVSAIIVIAVHIGGYRASAHAGLGITVMVLSGAQVGLAMVRPAPDAGEKRRMFTLAHRSLAFLCQFLAWVTMFLGLKESSSQLLITDTFYGVLGGGVGGIVLIWLFLEHRKNAAGDGKLPCQFMSRSSLLMALLSYGFTIGLGSLVWGATVRQ